MDERLQKQLDFALEIDKEKNIFRQTHLSGHGRNENDAEHAWHMAIMAYLLREYANERVNIERVMIMCLIHDIVEIDAGDTYAYDALENGDEAAIAGAYEDLIDAITNLEMKGNKAALKAMLEKAAAILADTDAYVASTIDGLATVKADAQNVYDNADAVQSEINAAVKSLTLKIAAARLLGDVNGDGAVTTSDSVSVLAASAELTSLDADATASADVNGDGVADTLDAALILQTAAEK